MDKAWKRTERKIAELLNGKRVPITGRTRGDAPDIKHKWLSIEVKHRKELPDWIKDAMRQAKASVRGDQLPVSVLHERGMMYRNSLVVIELSDFIDWFGAEHET